MISTSVLHLAGPRLAADARGAARAAGRPLCRARSALGGVHALLTPLMNHVLPTTRHSRGDSSQAPTSKLCGLLTKMRQQTRANQSNALHESHTLVSEPAFPARPSCRCPCRCWPQDYEVVVMVGAGIGVTPFASVLADLVNRLESKKCKLCGEVCDSRAPSQCSRFLFLPQPEHSMRKQRHHLCSSTAHNLQLLIVRAHGPQRSNELTLCYQAYADR